MSELFLRVLSMSVTASYVILFVLVVRLLLKKAPKIYSYALWGVVLIRLLCPISFESFFSLLPVGGQAIPREILYAEAPQIASGIAAIDRIVNAALPAATPYVSINPMQMYAAIGAVVWLVVAIGMVIYSAITAAMLTKQLKSARWIAGNQYETENFQMPFVFGILSPKIYLPARLSDTEISYILKHEQTHIKRLDHLVKPLMFLALCVHWFNPLVWVAFFMSTKDMELSCDERVIRELGSEIKQDYSATLLTLSTGRRIVGGCPLAFGENDTKSRIKNVLSFKKPAFWVVAVALIVVIGVCLGLMTNPKSVSIIGGADGPTSIFLANKGTSKKEREKAEAMLLQEHLQVTISEMEGIDDCTILVDINTLSGELSAYITLSIAPEHSFTLEEQEAIEKLTLNSISGLTKDKLYLSTSAYPTSFMLYKQNGEVVIHNTLSNVQIATELPALLLKSTGTTQESVNDTPINVDEYLRVNIGDDAERTYFVYEAQERYWVEKPYEYKNEIDGNTFNALAAYLHKVESYGTATAAPTENAFFVPDMDEEQQQYNQEYVEPLLLTGLLMRDWSTDNYASLLPDMATGDSTDYLIFAFEDIMGQERMKPLWDQYQGVFPAKVVEDVLLAHFPFTTDQLHEIMAYYYRPDQEAYEYEGGRGGGPIGCSVTAVKQQNNGIMLIEYVVFTSYYYEDSNPDEAYLSKLSGTLTLEQTASGGYRYMQVKIGEQVDIQPE